MPENKRIYLRLRHRVQVKPDQRVTLKQIALFVSHEDVQDRLESLVVHTVSPQDKHLIVIDVTRVVNLLKDIYPDLEVEIIGPSQTILEIVHSERSPRFLLVLFVWVLLFIGSGLTIMNFHEDVSMQAVHQRLYEMVTGEKDAYPLWLQVPYSIGIGLGMILFFNHLFKKRLNEEPSPLELEMFNYQQSIDQYVIMHENKEVQKKLNDRT
jgi:stage V sporulation protein AA